MEMGNCRERVWEVRCLNSWFADACHSSSTICCKQRLTHLNLKCMAKPKHDCVVYSLKTRCKESWSCRSTTMVTWRHKKEIPRHYYKLNLILKIRRTVTWLKKVRFFFIHNNNLKKPEQACTKHSALLLVCCYDFWSIKLCWTDITIFPNVSNEIKEK